MQCCAETQVERPGVAEGENNHLGYGLDFEAQGPRPGQVEGRRAELGSSWRVLQGRGWNAGSQTKDRDGFRTQRRDNREQEMKPME